MSFQAIAWALKTRTKNSERIVLTELANCHNLKTNKCNPSPGYISNITQLSIKTVKSALKLLEAKNLIKINRYKSPYSNYVSQSYCLQFDQKESYCDSSNNSSSKNSNKKLENSIFESDENVMKTISEEAQQFVDEMEKLSTQGKNWSNQTIYIKQENKQEEETQFLPLNKNESKRNNAMLDYRRRKCQEQLEKKQVSWDDFSKYNDLTAQAITIVSFINILAREQFPDQLFNFEAHPATIQKIFKVFKQGHDIETIRRGIAFKLREFKGLKFYNCITPKTLLKEDILLDAIGRTTANDISEKTELIRCPDCKNKVSCYATSCGCGKMIKRSTAKKTDPCCIICGNEREAYLSGKILNTSKCLQNPSNIENKVSKIDQFDNNKNYSLCKKHYHKYRVKSELDLMLESHMQKMQTTVSAKLLNAKPAPKNSKRI